MAVIFGITFISNSLAFKVQYFILAIIICSLASIAIAAVKNKEDKEKAEKFLKRLVDFARLPANTAAHLADDDFERYASNALEADLNIFPLPEELDADFLWKVRDATGSSCLFTQDGGDESALA